MPIGFPNQENSRTPIEPDATVKALKHAVQEARRLVKQAHQALSVAEQELAKAMADCMAEPANGLYGQN